MSATGRLRRDRLVNRVVSNPNADALEAMTWQEFELLVGEGFRLQGYQVHERGGAAPDGGVDLVANKDGEKYLVQCKHWKSHRVSVQIVRELFGVMAATGAAGGFVVASGSFTDEAAAFAKGRNINLVNGSKLTGMLRHARSSISSRTPSVSPTGSLEVAAPSCPKCAGPMQRKTARSGPNAGGTFWGCVKFPHCRGTRNEASA